MNVWFFCSYHKRIPTHDDGVQPFINPNKSLHSSWIIGVSETLTIKQHVVGGQFNIIWLELMIQEKILKQTLKNTSRQF
jgi:hypothetical protein